MMSRLASLCALALLSLAACDDSTGIVAADIACPTPQTLTYANYGQAVIETVYHSAMPEDGSMTNAERIQLGQWLSCGAP
jgi:hypothetical protein